MVFTEKQAGNQSKIKQRGDLEEEFGVLTRANEGEAANHGIYYDDTEYDYMQHMRDVGAGGEAVFLEAPSKGKMAAKGKMSLDDALRNMDLQRQDGVSVSSSVISRAESLLPEEMLPSEFVRKRTYQDQQDTPDAIAGFQPDMDPRLREVLEALDDEAYVEEDEDIFEALAQEAEEVDPAEWQASRWDDAYEERDEGWESDRTVKADQSNAVPDMVPQVISGAVQLPDTEDHGDGEWMAEFSKFKKDTKSKAAQKRLDLQSSILSTPSSLAGGRKKKRKGALTSTSGYSMTSSVLARTEGQSVLDARFDQIEEEYGEDNDLDDGASMMSGMSGFTGMSAMSTNSQAPQLVRADFNSAMEEFLGSHAKVGKRRVRKGRPETGLEQLENIRKELGPARVKGSAKT
ncbi:Low temperature viability protein [Tothia fuscella]|uniref:Low temperature viability protein n=1 Tax=Tothia fuscella TaxID=1048955 RepID=A0A9P4U2N9_9PEZI|nr:Low temperature viability protein [Tothia fuscella]